MIYIYICCFFNLILKTIKKGKKKITYSIFESQCILAIITVFTLLGNISQVKIHYNYKKIRMFSWMDIPNTIPVIYFLTLRKSSVTIWPVRCYYQTTFSWNYITWAVRAENKKIRKQIKILIIIKCCLVSLSRIEYES